ncbi:hypothetical protein MIND_00416600 [Mycena indigotica]|uniref:Dolichyl-diphosphooligosaccharide-protein glycosyltransferase subunit OST5 n=1 Tax=Mycena indigotica TaxID=2126181 RepID=A0A8H6W954_9AGAR|nr:uncharacterized protein MIND_00416600 [Mycena indigotica]KAF7306258.1 hypothetical protein MIND_00416600 [Mycena indigotica]
MDYTSLKSLYATSPAFSPLIPVGLLPYLAFILLLLTFTLGFYVSTLPKAALPVREVGVASLASVLGGFGVVALFCTLGVYV